MLKYGEGAWRFLTTRAGGAGYLNRWRLGQWLDALDRHGFRTDAIPDLIDDENLKRERPYFREPFRDMPDEQLRIVRATLVSRDTRAAPPA
jgi:hypothetical protein